eukprot:760765-Hanusia_phi.AAC.6
MESAVKLSPPRDICVRTRQDQIVECMLRATVSYSGKKRWRARRLPRVSPLSITPSRARSGPDACPTQRAGLIPRQRAAALQR